MNWRPKFESIDELGEKLCAKFSFTVLKITRGNSRKKGWSYFKLNIGD